MRSMLFCAVMTDEVNRFAEQARGLSRSPLGIVALFIVLVYGMASLVLMLSGRLSVGERVPLIWFLVSFPVVVLLVFVWMFARHAGRLYPPGEYSDESNFVKLMGGVGDQLREWRSGSVYRDIDVLYAELLKIGILNPDLVDPEKTSEYPVSFSDADRRKYDLYAFMSWNICETIYDWRDEHPDVYHTWLPVVRVEYHVHGRWFEEEKNRIGFKDEFQRYVLDKEFLNEPNTPRGVG